MSKARTLVFAILSVAIAAGWQALTVHVNFGGNWTALYYTGALFKGVPPDLHHENIFVFANSTGYDGQVYHYLAHDPLFHHRYAAFMDAPRYRGRRILIPGLAYLVAFGNAAWIDPAYLAVIWLFIGLGAYWLGRFGFLPMAFLLVPAVLVSIDRLTIDVALAAFCVAFALYSRENEPYKLYAVLAAAGLSRETGLLLPLAYCLFLASHRRWKAAAIFATTPLPALAWYVYLDSVTSPATRNYFSVLPLSGMLHRLFHSTVYPFSGIIQSVAVSLDALAVLGILAAVAWAGFRGIRRAWNPVTIALYLFALLAILLSEPDAWADVYAFGRTLTPLVILAALDCKMMNTLVPAWAMLAIDPRILLQWGPQILGVLRAL